MRPLIAVSALCLAQTALAAEGEFSLGTGLNYTTGTYGGSTSTKILTIPFNARYDNGPWTFKATLPYLHVTGVRAVYPGVGRVDNGTLDNLLGVPHRTDGGDQIGLAFDARQAGSPAPAPLRELTGFWTHKVDRNWRTQAYVLKGFARGSPDWGAGFSAAYAF